MTERNWTADKKNEHCIRLLVNEIHMVSVVYHETVNGNGWRVNSLSSNWPSSRRLWPTPQDAAKSALGKKAADAIKSLGG